MRFLGGLVNKISNTYHAIERQLTGAFAQQETQIQTPPVKTNSIAFNITTNTAGARAAALALLTVWVNQPLRNESYREIGQAGVNIIRELLEPIKRTGKTAASFRYRIDPSSQSVIIYSDAPQASSIQTGIVKAGSTQKLFDWLKTKDEHQDKSEQELKRMAFNIRRKIARGDAPGPGSDLARLSGNGERRFDYLGEAERQLHDEIETMLQQAVIRIEYT